MKLNINFKDTGLYLVGKTVILHNCVQPTPSDAPRQTYFVLDFHTNKTTGLELFCKGDRDNQIKLISLSDVAYIKQLSSEHYQYMKLNGETITVPHQYSEGLRHMYGIASSEYVKLRLYDKKPVPMFGRVLSNDNACMCDTMRS